MKTEIPITHKLRHVLIAAIVLAVSLIAAPWGVEVVEAACERACAYTYDAEGNTHVECQQFGAGSDCTESRHSCLGTWMDMQSPSTCKFCGSCHAPKKTYTLKTPQVHKAAFPKFQVLLSAGSKIPWGDGTTLMAEKDGTLIKSDKYGKPMWKFPAGSIILKGASGKPEMVQLSGKPVVLLAPKKPISLR